MAQLIAQLLSVFQKREAGIVHVYPSTSQLPIGADRLERRLDTLVLRSLQGSPARRTRPIRIVNGLSVCTFFSGHPLAKAEGATANLLLVVNEAQDHIPTIVDRRFTPMRSSTNSTAVYVGTVRTTGDYLWRKKQELERLQSQDGKRRVYVVSPEMVGESNPSYWEFVQNQVRVKGRDHPAIKTEYFNEPVDTSDRLFSERRVALMRGDHLRLRSPQLGEFYIALIDVGGQDEAATSAFSELYSPGRNYTVCTIVRVELRGGLLGPNYSVVDVFSDQGSRHFQDAPGQPSLFSRLLAYIAHWGCLAVICDFTGVGQGITDALQKSYDRLVKGFDFASGFNKSRLGNNFLALVETARFKWYAGEESEPGSDGWWFFQQLQHCGYELRAGQPIERAMKWGVSDSARVDLLGKSVPVHDDYLLSAALVAEADILLKTGEIRLSAGESYVIPNREISERRGGWS